MASKYRTAQGRTLDMAALAAKNEKARAVGNMKVNARGDTIDSEGKVVVPVTEKVATNYAATVGTRSAHAKKSGPKATQAPEPEYALTEEERELIGDEENDAEVEAIKAKESKK
jgi:hypothetical protein